MPAACEAECYTQISSVGRNAQIMLVEIDAEMNEVFSALQDLYAGNKFRGTTKQGGRK